MRLLRDAGILSGRAGRYSDGRVSLPSNLTFDTVGPKPSSEDDRGKNRARAGLAAVLIWLQGTIRTCDLQVMSLTSYRAALPCLKHETRRDFSGGLWARLSPLIKDWHSRLPNATVLFDNRDRLPRLLLKMGLAQ